MGGARGRAHAIGGEILHAVICSGSSGVVAVVWRLVVFGGYCDDSGGVDVVVRVVWGDEGGREAMGCGVEGGDEVVWQRCDRDVVVGMTMVM
ncbi:hypothetical protein Tco_1224298 [Tanacetum coccineum]